MSTKFIPSKFQYLGYDCAGKKQSKFISNNLSFRAGNQDIRQKILAALPILNEVSSLN